MVLSLEMKICVYFFPLPLDLLWQLTPENMLINKNGTCIFENKVWKEIPNAGAAGTIEDEDSNDLAWNGSDYFETKVDLEPKVW